MDLDAELAPFDLPPELVGRLRQWAEHTREAAATAPRQAADVTRLEAELKASKLKIEALVHELAVLKRLRFGARSEALRSSTVQAEERRFREARPSIHAGFSLIFPKVLWWHVFSISALS